MAAMAGLAGLTWVANRHRTFPVRLSLGLAYGLGSGFLILPSWREGPGQLMRRHMPEALRDLHAAYLRQYRRLTLAIADGLLAIEPPIRWLSKRP